MRDIGVCISLAQLCYNGSSSAPPDKPAALRWYLRAAEAGSIDAQYKAAILCIMTAMESRLTKGMAFRWFQYVLARENFDMKSAEHYNGEYLSEYITIYWLKKAADQDNQAAKYILMNI